MKFPRLRLIKDSNGHISKMFLNDVMLPWQRFETDLADCTENGRNCGLHQEVTIKLVCDLTIEECEK